MISLQEYTPDIYYSESRDFQFIGRLFDLVLNYSKTNADLLYSLPISDNSDDQFIELMSLTLGFRAKHKYTAKHMRAVCNAFPAIMRNKGTLAAVLIACNAIFHADGVEGEVNYELSKNNMDLTIYVPPEVGDTTLLTDLFSYIVPAGVACHIIKVVQINITAKTRIAITDKLTIYAHGDNTPISVTDNYILYNNNRLAVIPQYSENSTTDRGQFIVNTGDAIRALAADTQGLLANSSVYKPENEDDAKIITPIDTTDTEGDN